MVGGFFSSLEIRKVYLNIDSKNGDMILKNDKENIFDNFILLFEK